MNLDGFRVGDEELGGPGRERLAACVSGEALLSGDDALLDEPIDGTGSNIVDVRGAEPARVAPLRVAALRAVRCLELPEEL